MKIEMVLLVSERNNANNMMIFKDILFVSGTGKTDN